MPYGVYLGKFLSPADARAFIADLRRLPGRVGPMRPDQLFVHHEDAFDGGVYALYGARMSVAEANAICLDLFVLRLRCQVTAFAGHQPADAMPPPSAGTAPATASRATRSPASPAPASPVPASLAPAAADAPTSAPVAAAAADSTIADPKTADPKMAGDSTTDSGWERYLVFPSAPAASPVVSPAQASATGPAQPVGSRPPDPTSGTAPTRPRPGAGL